MDSREIRESFLRFFEERGHRRLPGAPLVPPGDPTLLFTSAGMVQFKPYFMGQAKPPQPRLTTAQKCFRTSDIDAVGDTAHLTFFEMLGNFSVGDYFKAEAIPWAWELLTAPRPQGMGLDRSRLWATIYLEDDEAFEIWRKVGIPAERIIRFDESENYWFSGPIGPCGPNSEVYYDFGGDQGCGAADCAPPLHTPPDCSRFLELWNLVFMTLYQDEKGRRTPLPARNIDTGAGLERWPVPIMWQDSIDWQGKPKRWREPPSVYDTDLFGPIIRRIEELSGKTYGADPQTDRAMRIAAEHGRAVTFLIGDERTPVLPSNEERGYVVRRILRRAVYFGRRYLGLEEPFLADVAETVIAGMSGAYPELERQRAFVLEIVGPEERRFEETLSRGLELVDETLTRHRPGSAISGEDVFVLHDTYGFPLELTREIAAERGFTVDEAGFQAEMEKQRERGRAAAGTGEALAAEAVYASLGDIQTAFVGYETLETQTTILAILRDGERVEGTSTRDPRPATLELLLAETPFYPEGGGQVGDRGEIIGANGRVAVEDAQRAAERLIVHRGRVVEGRVAAGDAVTARVDPQRRADTMRNHTATHLLHSALRKVLGPHVRQSGSLVAPDRLRFDFTHTEALTGEQQADVQRLVNEKVRENLPVETRLTTFDQAMSEGVLAFFGEKYGEEVRVVEVNSVVPRFSAELCGGTHCARTGDVGFFLITAESSIGAGLRRLEALTGRGAEEYVRSQLAALDGMARRLGAPREAAGAKVEAVMADLEALRKRVERLERSLASAPATGQLLREAVEVDGVRVLAARVEAPSVEALRYLADAVRKAMPSGVAVLASVTDERPQFVVIATADIVRRGLSAVEVLKRVAAVAGGGGGGRPEMAQGGGKDASKLDDALASAPGAVKELLGQRS